MNSWRDAILQAQQKIDQVLDIKPEREEEEEEIGAVHVEIEPIAFFEDSIDEQLDITVSPPPISNDPWVSDEVPKVPGDFPTFKEQTKVPTECISPTAQNILNLEKKCIETVNEEKIDQTIEDLRKELNEYREANKVLQANCMNLEHKMEEDAFAFNQKMMNLINEEKLYSELQIVQLKNKCSELGVEKKNLEEALSTSSFLLNNTKKCLNHCKQQLKLIATCLEGPNNGFYWDFEKLGSIVENYLKTVTNNATIPSSQQQVSCTCKNNVSSDLREMSTQTDKQVSEQSKPQPVLEKASLPIAPTTSNNNATELLWIIEKLETEKKDILTILRRKSAEVNKLRNQLSETLIMHGEKIEVLDELRIDNEDLREILKQQALEFSFHEG